jgi:uncharacterized membrane protein YkoI
MNRTKKLIAAGAGAAVALAAGTGVAFAVADDDDDALHGRALQRATTAALAHTGGGRVTDAEVEDDGPGRYEIEVTTDDGREIDLHLSESFRVLDGTSASDRTIDLDDAPLPAEELERVGQAAIAATPGARVVEVDVDDDTGHYDVDVVLADGSEVDVTVDRDLRVLASVPDPLDTDTDTDGDG